MKKVLIDVQQNYGGDLFLAVDTYKQFFPNQEPYGGSRMRATNPTNAMGDAITSYWEGLNDTDADYYEFYDDEWMPLTRIDADTNDNFTSWDEFYGPHVYNGDSFTKTVSLTVDIELIRGLIVSSNDTTSPITLSVHFRRKMRTMMDLLSTGQMADQLIPLSRMLLKM